MIHYLHITFYIFLLFLLKRHGNVILSFVKRQLNIQLKVTVFYFFFPHNDEEIFATTYKEKERKKRKGKRDKANVETDKDKRRIRVWLVIVVK